MSKTSMLLRSVLPLAAVTFLSLPPTANADPTVCTYFIPATECSLKVTMTPVNPDPPTVICPQGEIIYELSFAVVCGESICWGTVPNPIIVCGAWNTDLVLNVCGANHTLDVKKAWRWRDVAADCSKAQLL